MEEPQPSCSSSGSPRRKRPRTASPQYSSSSDEEEERAGLPLPPLEEAAPPFDVGEFCAATHKRMDDMMDLFRQAIPQPAAPIPSAPTQATDTIQNNIVQGSLGGVILGERPGAHLQVLGRTVDGEIRKKILSGLYFDIGSLAKVVPHKKVTVEFLQEAPSFTLTPQRAAQPQSFSAWMDLFLVYMAIRLEAFPAEGPLLVTYIARIKELSQRESLDVWLSYDQEFRKMKALNPGLAWTKIDQDLLFPLQPGRLQEAFRPAKQQAPPPSAQSFRGTTPPRGVRAVLPSRVVPRLCVLQKAPPLWPLQEEGAPPQSLLRLQEAATRQGFRPLSTEVNWPSFCRGTTQRI